MAFGLLAFWRPLFRALAFGLEGHRWLQLPGGLWGEFVLNLPKFLNFQPVFYLGRSCFEKEKLAQKYSLTVITALVFFMLLLLKQPDFGSFSIILFVGIGLLFAFGLSGGYEF